MIKNIQLTKKHKLILESKDKNRNLSKNREWWWLNFTMHNPDKTSERHRVNLKTRDKHVARERRDNIFAAILEATTEQIK